MYDLFSDIFAKPEHVRTSFGAETAREEQNPEADEKDSPEPDSNKD
jgi:hypothetical protein